MLLASRRRRARAFWGLFPDRLVVAVLRAATHEPLLLGCAVTPAGTGSGATSFAPGLLETAVAAGAEHLAHFVALGSVHARLACDEDGSVDVENGRGGQAGGLFRRAGLALRAVDCEECALANLSATLGEDATWIEGTERPSFTASLEPLAAVAVAPEAEDPTLTAGGHLPVPVGLALGRFRRGAAHVR